MNDTAILLLSMTMGVISYSLIAKWYLMPYLAKQSRLDAFTPLLLLHSFRYIGMAFLINGVVSQTLPAIFSHPAAYGDLLAAVLALIALMAVRLRWSGALVLVWIFNIAGSLDLLNALIQGLWHIAPMGNMGATYFIPAVIVPALLVTHVIIFLLLLRPRR